jgi:hypothetical protein
MDETEDAMSSYKEALMIRSKVLATMKVATVPSNMGTLEFRAESWTKALKLLERRNLLGSANENGTKEDGDYVNVCL